MAYCKLMTSKFQKVTQFQVSSPSVSMECCIYKKKYNYDKGLYHTSVLSESYKHYKYDYMEIFLHFQF